MTFCLQIKEASEKEIQDEIFCWLLHQPNLFAFKVETQGVYNPKTRTFRKAGKWVVKGTADILVCVSIQRSIGQPMPIFVALEVKSRLGKQSPDQVTFQARVQAVNGFYYIVRSIADVQRAIVEIKNQFTF